MLDVVSLADGSRMIAGIQDKNTRPELIVRRMLFASGYRFRLHRPANKWCPKPAQDHLCHHSFFYCFYAIG
jgi:G:T-mismatch repair DNA endonuclease (very short patch repair protein)